MPLHRIGPTRIGIAYADDIQGLLERGLVDFVEVPFERLRHDAQVLERLKGMPLILHCASLSLASAHPCKEETLAQIKHWSAATHTPWVGEHVAFVRAAGPQNYEVGYTVAPPMNAQSVRRVASNIDRYSRLLGCRLAVENSPLYFNWPSSTLGQPEFLRRILDDCDAGLLLDLTHFGITASNFGFDAMSAVSELPLDRVVEIHLSGCAEQDALLWDDHASRVPEAVFSLLEKVLRCATPSAITLEYNWSPRLEADAIEADLGRIRSIAVQ